MNNIPRSFLNVIFSLNIHDLQLDGIHMSQTDEAFFSHVPPSVKTFTFLRLGLPYSTLNLSAHHLSIFPRHFHFRRLDSISLAHFQSALDPLTNPGIDVTVESFRILFYVTESDAFYQLTRRFLHHASPSLEQLWISFHTNFLGK